jgi:hypothetical protein
MTLAITPKLEMRLVRRSILTMSETELARVKMIVDYLAESQLAVAKNGKTTLSRGDIALIIFKGLEMGFEPMAALESIDLISGKPTLDPAGMLAIAQASGQLEDIQFIEESDTASEILMKRVGQSPYTRRFTIEDARKMTTTEWRNGSSVTIPLADKANWKSMPSIMLKCRNISQMCRYYLGDVITLYTPEELGANVNVDTDGHMLVVAEPLAQKQLSAGQDSSATWANADTITKLLDTLCSEKYGIQGSEAIRLAGIDPDKGRDPAEWNKRFETGKAAFEYIKAEFDKVVSATPPAKPKRPAQLTDEMLIEALEDLYPHQLADFEEALGYSLMEKALTLQDALNRVAAIITQQSWSVLASRGTYKAASGKTNQHYTELQTGIGTVRVYGRDTFKQMSEAFYEENKIAEWKPGQQIEFNAPLIVTWEQKGGYKLATEIDLYAPEDWEQPEPSEMTKALNSIGQ